MNEKNKKLKELNFSMLDDMFMKKTPPINKVQGPGLAGLALVLINKDSPIKHQTEVPILYLYFKLTFLFKYSIKLKTLSFLDQKQTMGFTVFLKQIKMPLNEYTSMIKNGKSKEIGLDGLNCLKKLLPESNEAN